MIGMIHGRFQPFTIGHMAYVKEVLNKVDNLIIGITNPDPTSINIVDSDDHRHLPDANPFSFYERLQMIKQSILLDEEICDRFQDISIIPFFVHKPDLWKYYFPTEGVIQYINIFDEWDVEKRNTFHNLGYITVDIKLPRITSATDVRALLHNNDKRLMDLVPKGTFYIINEIYKGNCFDE